MRSVFKEPQCADVNTWAEEAWMFFLYFFLYFEKPRRLECGIRFIAYCNNVLYAYLVNGLYYMILITKKDKLSTSCYFDNMCILWLKILNYCLVYGYVARLNCVIIIINYIIKKIELFNFLLFVHMHNYKLIGLGLTYDMPSLWVWYVEIMWITGAAPPKFFFYI